MEKSLHQKLVSRKNYKQKSFAVLIDPEKTGLTQGRQLIALAQQQAVDFFFVGGSLYEAKAQQELLALLKAESPVPVVLFPGPGMAIDMQADALLFLSLVSGRNPDLLIGQHVQVAPLLKNSPIEVISTAYMLIDPGHPTSVSYISNTQPIPRSKSSIASATALAAQLLGMKLVYMDAGSGAQLPVPKEMITEVCATIEVPLIVGGGINTPQKAREALEAGADLIVIGNGIEKNPNLIIGVSQVVTDYNAHHALHIHK
jgi:phosphoglycerol geranylgeranyltransferase